MKYAVIKGAHANAHVQKNRGHYHDDQNLFGFQENINNIPEQQNLLMRTNSPKKPLNLLPIFAGDQILYQEIVSHNISK